jgi:hypothetical protein
MKDEFCFIFTCGSVVVVLLFHADIPFCYLLFYFCFYYHLLPVAVSILEKFREKKRWISMFIDRVCLFPFPFLLLATHPLVSKLFDLFFHPVLLFLNIPAFLIFG